MRDVKVREINLDLFLKLCIVVFFMSGVMLYIYCLFYGINPLVDNLVITSNPLLYLGVGFTLVNMLVFKGFNDYRFRFKIVLFFYMCLIGFFIYLFVFSSLGL